MTSDDETSDDGEAARRSMRMRRKNSKEHWQNIEARVRRTSHTVNVMQEYVEEAADEFKGMEIELLAERVRKASMESSQPIARERDTDLETMRSRSPEHGKLRRPSRSIAPLVSTHMMLSEMAKPSPKARPRALQPVAEKGSKSRPANTVARLQSALIVMATGSGNSTGRTSPMVAAGGNCGAAENTRLEM